MTIRRGTFAILFVAVALNFFLSIPSAQAATSVTNIQCVITNSTTTIGNCIAAAIPLALLGLGLSLMMVGVVYMMGEVFQYDRLKRFYQNELWETIKSALIVVLVFSSLVVASAIAS